MKQRDKFKPYIRLMNGRETSSDFRTSLRLSMLGGLRHDRKVYVMVQKGFPNAVMAVGLSKREIKQRIFTRKRFNDWANDVKKYAQSK